MYDGMPVQLTTGKKTIDLEKLCPGRVRWIELSRTSLNSQSIISLIRRQSARLYPPGSGFGGGAQRARYMAVRARRLV